MFSEMLIALAIQVISAPSVATPEFKTSFGEEELEIKRQSLNIKPLLPSSLDKPTDITSSSIESYDDVESREKTIRQYAYINNIQSYVNISSGYLAAGCSEISRHPSGVRRKSDGKLNGLSFLVKCQKQYMQIIVMDYSEGLEQGIKSELPNKYFSIKGGFLAASFGKDEKGNTRRDINAIGNNTSVDMVVYGKIDTPSDSSLKESISMIEYLISK